MHRQRSSSTPETEEDTPLLGGTRGAAKDASERVKAQAIIAFYKKLVECKQKMVAYAFAAKTTNNCDRSAMSWVKLENDLGLDGLECRRSGRETSYSPTKKTRIDT